MNKDICYKIYTEEFGNDDFSVELFEKCYKYCNFYKVEDDIVSIVFLLPCKIIIKGKNYNAKYVFAVTTAKEYRGKGYMREFIKQICDDDCIYFLKPANDTLISYYDKLGYKPFTAIKGRGGEKTVEPCSEFLSLAEGITEFNEQEYTAMYYYKKQINLNGLNFAYTME